MAVEGGHDCGLGGGICNGGTICLGCGNPVGIDPDGIDPGGIIGGIPGGRLYDPSCVCSYTWLW